MDFARRGLQVVSQYSGSDHVLMCANFCFRLTICIKAASPAGFKVKNARYPEKEASVVETERELPSDLLTSIDDEGDSLDFFWGKLKGAVQ